MWNLSKADLCHQLINIVPGIVFMTHFKTLLTISTFPILQAFFTEALHRQKDLWDFWKPQERRQFSAKKILFEIIVLKNDFCVNFENEKKSSPS